MKTISLFFGCLLLSACSFNVVEMASDPTVQKFDLTDPEADGIINARDACPDSFQGADVNNNGCGSETVTKKRLKLLVNFAADSSQVEAKYYPEIEKLAEFMLEYPSVTVVIEGHTSIKGGAAYNKALSLKRAKAIKSLLVNKYGVDNTRVTAVGYGFERLLLEGNDEYINARNRRIVAEISSDVVIKNMKWTIYSVDQRTE